MTMTAEDWAVVKESMEYPWGPPEENERHGRAEKGQAEIWGVRKNNLVLLELAILWPPPPPLGKNNESIELVQGEV